MNEQQQELYEKLLKKVNEYCLGQAAEDVIEAIDDLVDTYETPKVDPVPPLEALKEFTNNQYKDKNAYDDEMIKTVEEALKEAEKNKKALEIIKYRSVNVLRFQISPNCEQYNKHFNKYSGCNLTQEEYNLLKEVLK